EGTGRRRADGSEAPPLDRAELVALARRLASMGVTSIAIVFLHAYANAAHEGLAARLVTERHPDLAVTASHEVAPEIREYERASTTVLNAYINPLAQRYPEAIA